MTTTTSTISSTVTLSSGAEISIDQLDGSRPFLLLHGGGGVATMAGFANLLAARRRTRVLLPTHPGFGGTPRAAGLDSTRELAAAYVALLDELDVRDVTVLGNSFGGWVAAEMALLGSPRLATAVVVDGIGIEVDGLPMTDVRGLAPADLQKLSFHDPSRAPVAPAGATGPSPDVQALVGYAGPTMSDPTLRERLAGIDVPVHVIWGAGDGIVAPAYGEAFAAAIPGSTFTLLPATGHLPQVETPEELLAALPA